MKRLAVLLVALLATACSSSPTGPTAAVTAPECLEWRSAIVQTGVGPIHISYCVRWSDERL